MLLEAFPISANIYKMSGLDTIGNDVFLLLVDSLEAIVQHELEGMPSDSATRPQRAQLRNSLLHLSSVNKGFRSVLKRRCFSTIRLYSTEYSQDKITSWMETVNRHDTLQHDMMYVWYLKCLPSALT